MSISNIEKSIGIINPIDKNDWLEIVAILIAQISRTVD